MHGLGLNKAVMVKFLLRGDFMGYLKNGEWITDIVNPETEDGEFHRQQQFFRDNLGTKYKAQKERYHLYVSLACPWAHRTLIMRKLKKLDQFIDISIVHPHMLDHGWSFDQDMPEATGDKKYKLNFLKDLYTKAKKDFTGRVTVPVLFDLERQEIVNNESADIMRIFNSEFNELTEVKTDYYPKHLRAEIDQINEEVYHNINNGVYKTGFARKQKAYEKNFLKLFKSLDHINNHLKNKEYLVGDQLTEADIRLFTTLIRFDCVYFVHFKCNKKMIKDYSELNRYLKNLYAIPAFRDTTHFNHIKEHYYFSHQSLNPFQIVPLGPELDNLNS